MQKRRAALISLCILEAILFILVLILLPETVRVHPVAFVLTGVLIFVSAGSITLLDRYYRMQQTVQQAEYEIKKRVLEEQIDFALRGIGGGVLIAKDDAEKTFVYVSEPLAALFGYTVEEFLQVSNNKSSGIVYEEDFPVLSEEITGESNTLRFRVRCKDGSLKWVSSRGKIVINEKGERERFSFNHDITQLMEINKTAEELMETLKQERQLYRDVLLYNCDYAYIVNVDENRFHDVYKGDFLNRYLFDATQPYDEVMERIVDRMKPVILYNKPEAHFTAHYIRAYEEGTRYMEVEYYVSDVDAYKKKSIFLSRGNHDTLYAFIVAHDITETKKEELHMQAALAQLAESAKKVGTGHLDVTFDANAPGHVGVLADVLNQTVLYLRWHTEKLKSQAMQDSMTGVKNKRAWLEAEKRLDRQIQDGSANFAIIVCDVNGLKEINDTEGHEAGDDLIICASRHICRTFKHSPVYRIGGDEFAVILEGDDLLHHEALLASFYSDVTEPVQDEKVQHPISIALGLAHFQKEDMTASDVFQRADMSMYHRKKEMKRQEM